MGRTSCGPAAVLPETRHLPVLGPGLRRDERIGRWIFALAILLAFPALAQERTPSERQSLVDLARTLGESHALRQVCTGAQDQHWRRRMQTLLDQEAADQRLKTRLSVAFNDGYRSGQALYPKCTDAARAEARKVAVQGRALSLRLAGPQG